MEGILEGWLNAEVARRRPTFNPENISDMVDAYMAVDAHKAIPHDNFVRMLVDLFLGGNEASAEMFPLLQFF